MSPENRSSWRAHSFSCWNWKCALLSATARSIVYLSAMWGAGPQSRSSVVLVEMAYVTLTAGLYAGLQQRALSLRSRRLGDLIVVLGVPGLSQALDWVAHRAAGAAAPPRATLAACVFAGVSALFHLYVMRSGAFLTGHGGNTLADDLRRIPRLVAGFAVAPLAWMAALAPRSASAIGVESAR